MLPSTSFVEENLRKFGDFVMYALLEWIVIVLLFVQSLLGLLCNQFARLFGLKVPCLLCTRIDHLLLHKNDSNSHYNEFVCEDHKMGISSLTYCNLHKKLSDINSMCQGCLISFTTERDPYKSIFSRSNEDDVDFFDGNDGRKILMNPSKKDDGIEIGSNDKTASVLQCSCCGEAIKLSKSSSKYKRMMSMSAPSMSPRALFLSKNKGGNLDFMPARFPNLKLVADSKLELPEVEDTSTLNHTGIEDGKYTDYMMTDFSSRTPSTRVNKFFGIPLSDSATMSNSPKWAINGKSSSRKLSPERLDSMMEPSETDNDLLARLKQQIRTDREALMELQMELDEERSASATAANNAMAMISRLQAEKAAVQMEALQYQRMTEEQAEYDEEALQMMKELLYKKDEEIKALESELEMYRGPIQREDGSGNEMCEVAVSPKSDLDDFDDDF